MAGDSDQAKLDCIIININLHSAPTFKNDGKRSMNQIANVYSNSCYYNSLNTCSQQAGVESGHETKCLKQRGESVLSLHSELAGGNPAAAEV